jgi:hypothetical protein
MSPSVSLRAMSYVEWLADLSGRSLPHRFCDVILCDLRGSVVNMFFVFS